MFRNVPPYDYAVDIDRSDIDFMGHVNNATYLKWGQAAIISHWERMAPAEALKSHAWVALRHEITYRKPAFVDDDVIATVILEKVHGAKAFYGIIIKRGKEVLAEVKSSWCCLDAATKRPKRLSSAIIDGVLSRRGS